ncbi:MAG: hypothetical protein M3Q65_16485 [Chloroflexota bacterium]|nr:hypothetical protein [Chloroflexota bacterium]
MPDEAGGYGRNAAPFAGFPDDIRRYRAVIGQEDLERVRYIDHDYWAEPSGASPLPVIVGYSEGLAQWPLY